MEFVWDNGSYLPPFRLRMEMVFVLQPNFSIECQKDAVSETPSQEQNASWSRQLEEMFQRLEALEPDQLEGVERACEAACWQACLTRSHRKYRGRINHRAWDGFLID